MSKGWDNIMLKKLKALTGKGLSTSEIGKRLGMSKNAIVGKLNRLGWNAKAAGTSAVVVPAKPEKKTAPKKESTKGAGAKKTAEKPEKKVVATKKVVEEVKEEKPKATPKVVIPKATSKKADNKVLAVHQRIVQHSLEMAALKPNQCRWPIGDPDSEGFHFCGETVFVGKPYCYEHCKQAYQFAPPKKK